jgi:hypothetical protein
MTQPPYGPGGQSPYGPGGYGPGGQPLLGPGGMPFYGPRGEALYGPGGVPLYGPGGVPRPMSEIWFGPPIPPDAPYEPLAIVAFVSGLLFMPFALVFGLIGLSRAARFRRKGRVLAAIGTMLGGLSAFTCCIAIVAVIFVNIAN